MPPQEQNQHLASSSSRPIGPSSNDAISSGSDNDDHNSSSKKTQVFHTRDGAPYVICDSGDPFVNPTTPPEMANPADVIRYQRLNLDLGQTLITRNNNNNNDDNNIPWLLVIVQWLDRWVLQPWEIVFFCAWAKLVPLSVRRVLAHGGWKIYFQCHQYLLGRRTGMHPSQSEEYHALTTLMWGARFLTITPRRIRFSLSQLHVCTPNQVQADLVEHIEVHNTVTVLSLQDKDIPVEQKDHCTVRGLYLHRQRPTTTTSSPRPKSTTKTIFWAYGGAYLGGNTEGNSAAADWVGLQCGMDVFLPNFRLAPEADLDDVLWDFCLAYRWLCSRVEDPSSNIVVVGVSSGGGLCARLLQIIAHHDQQGQHVETDHDKNNDKEEQDDGSLPAYISGLPAYISNLVSSQTSSSSNSSRNSDRVQYMPMPLAGVLLGPYVDYTKEKKGTFLHYPRLDLVVTEAVQEGGLPYLEGFIPRGERRAYSPVYQSMKGLPPLCVITSEHESVYDMNVELVNRARAEGVPVTLGVWKYMCHVFGLLWAFVPEGELAMNFVVDWILRQQQRQKQQQQQQKDQQQEQQQQQPQEQ
jgi:epsilon-lactone hydrolase